MERENAYVSDNSSRVYNAGCTPEKCDLVIMTDDQIALGVARAEAANIRGAELLEDDDQAVLSVPNDKDVVGHVFSQIDAARKTIQIVNP